MKKLVFLVLSAIALSTANAQESPVTFSTEDNEVWYYLQFTRRVDAGEIYKVVRDAGVNQPLKQGKGRIDNPAHKWKFVGTNESFKVISGIGNELSNDFDQAQYAEDEDYFGIATTVTSGEGKEFYFKHPSSSVWILGPKEYENNETEWSYGAFLNDIETGVCLYAYMNDGSDTGNELLFVGEADFIEEELPESPVIFSPAEDDPLADENGNVWYYLQFQRSIQYDEEGNLSRNLAIEDYGYDEYLIQVDKTDSKYQWWKFVGNMEGFHIESYDANKFSLRVTRDEENNEVRRIYSDLVPSRYELVGNPDNGWQIRDIDRTSNPFLNDEYNGHITTYVVNDPGNYVVFTPVKSSTSLLPSTSVEKTTIYPNPAKGYINVVTIPATTAITILNSLGQSIIEAKPVGKSVEKINISTLAAGIYFLTIENGTARETAKLLVK
jgi:hypothetical protein